MGWEDTPSAITDAQRAFLDLFDRLLPLAYIGPLKYAGPGYELLQAYALLYARVLVAVNRADLQAFIASATSGVKATGTAILTRPGITAGAVTVKAGTILTASKSGRRFLVSKDATFTAGGGSTTDLAVTASLEAEAPGYEYNSAGPATGADGTQLVGDIDTLTTLITDPAYGDATIVLSAAGETSGGLPPLLDALGKDVGVDRSVGETDTQYRQRIRTLPDTVSPGALRRAITAAFAQFAGVATPQFIETWQQDYQTNFDFICPYTIWHLDEIGATTGPKDSVGTVGDLTVTGSLPTATGAVGFGRHFSANNYARKTAASLVTRFDTYFKSMSFTLEIAFNPDVDALLQSPSNGKMMLSINDTVANKTVCAIMFSGTVIYAISDYLADSILGYVPGLNWTSMRGRWNHLMMRWRWLPIYGAPPSVVEITTQLNGAKTVSYGELSDSSYVPITLPLTLTNPSNDIILGNNKDLTNPFYGSLDEAALWLGAMDDDAMSARYQHWLLGRGLQPAAAVNKSIFVYDDPLGTTPLVGDAAGRLRGQAGFFNRWLDQIEQRGALIATVPPLSAVLDFGMAYDDPNATTGAPSPSTYTTPHGRRAMSAYDMTSAAPSTVLQGCYDGFDSQRAAVYLNMFKAMQRIKPAGVAAILELQGQ